MVKRKIVFFLSSVVKHFLKSRLRRFSNFCIEFYLLELSKGVFNLIAVNVTLHTILLAVFNAIVSLRPYSMESFLHDEVGALWISLDDKFMAAQVARHVESEYRSA